MTWHRPKLVSERERGPSIWVDGKSHDDARWEDCGPCAVLMAVDGHTNGVVPKAKTLEEAERLRWAAGYGPTGGTNIQRLAAGAVTRYHLTLPRYASGFDAIWSALKPGTCAALAGSMAAFGPSHRLSRWQTWFDGAHAVYVARESSLPRVAWIDPLAPSGAYTGDWVSRDELRLFLGRNIAAAVVWPLAKEAI